ncbi:hypothetical protein V8E55_007901 [Tylopilus felleus]
MGTGFNSCAACNHLNKIGRQNMQIVMFSACPERNLFMVADMAGGGDTHNKPPPMLSQLRIIFLSQTIFFYTYRLRNISQIYYGNPDCTLKEFVSSVLEVMAKLSSGPVTEYRVHDCSMFVIDDPMTTVIVSPSEAQDTTFLHKRADVDIWNRFFVQLMRDLEAYDRSGSKSQQFSTMHKRHVFALAKSVQIRITSRQESTV